MKPALRCRHPGCNGQLYAESDLGGHVITWRCFHCGRDDSISLVAHLIRDGDISPEDANRLYWQGAAFVWGSRSARVHACSD